MNNLENCSGREGGGIAMGGLGGKQSCPTCRNTAEAIKAPEIDPTSRNLLFYYVAGPRYHYIHYWLRDTVGYRNLQFFRCQCYVFYPSSHQLRCFRHPLLLGRFHSTFERP